MLFSVAGIDKVKSNKEKAREALGDRKNTHVVRETPKAEKPISDEFQDKNHYKMFDVYCDGCPSSSQRTSVSKYVRSIYLFLTFNFDFFFKYPREIMPYVMTEKHP